MSLGSGTSLAPQSIPGALNPNTPSAPRNSPLVREPRGVPAGCGVTDPGHFQSLPGSGSLGAAAPAPPYQALIARFT